MVKLNRKTAFEEEEEDPMTGVANLVDAMLVIAVAGNSLQRQRNSTREAGCNQCHEAGNRDRPGTAPEPDT